MSCASHLQNIYVSYYQGGAYELRCQGCYSSASAWRTFRWILIGIIIVIMAIFFFGFWLPGFLDMKKKHEEFDREWDKNQRERNKSFP